MKGVSVSRAGIAYCAGLFDGEGCILLAKHHTYQGQKETAYGRQPNYRYRMDIRLNQTRPESVAFMQEVLGGTVYFLPKGYGPKKDKIYSGRWHWEMADAVAAQALKAMLPYLLIKKAEAVLAIKFQATKFPAVQLQGGRSRKLGRTPYEVEFHQWCFEEMKRLKQFHKESPMQEQYLSMKDSLRRQQLHLETSGLTLSTATKTDSA
jgi:hypothetical protein